MKIRAIIWKEQYLEKIEVKHHLSSEEVEEVFDNRPHIKRVEKGTVKGENLYLAYGQTMSGRYLVVFFLYKEGASALPISARDMTDSERKYYDKRK